MDIEPEQVLTLVRDKGCAESLMRHERNGLVVNTSGAYYYLDPATGQYRVLSGLLPRLHAVYWPESNIYRTMKRCPRKKGGRAKPKKNGGRFAGLINGTKVHQELRDFVVLDQKNFKKSHKTLHNYTTRLLKVIVERMRWQPFLPEFDICDEALGIGTSIDMVCVERSGDLVLLEFKTGYKDYFEKQDGFMRHSLSRLSNTIRNQATMQLTTSALILHRKYGVPLRRMHLFVMRVDEVAIDIVPVPPDFLTKMGDSIYDDLLKFKR
jgi:hypothetical protein